MTNSAKNYSSKLDRFHSRDHRPWFTETKDFVYITEKEFVAVSLFWYTTMDAMTSRENDL